MCKIIAEIFSKHADTKRGNNSLGLAGVSERNFPRKYTYSPEVFKSELILLLAPTRTEDNDICTRSSVKFNTEGNTTEISVYFLSLLLRLVTANIT